MRIWTFLFVLILATGVGILLRQDPGYALFAYGNWTLEMPLWLAVTLLLLVVIVALVGYSLLNLILTGSSRIKNWWHQRKQKNARLKTTQGLLELAEGHWRKAEKDLIKSASMSDAPLINYLSAAKAAEGGGSIERRDEYLQLAVNSSEGSEVAVRLTQAQLQFEQGQLEQSAETLRQLHEKAPKNIQVIKLLCTVYEALKDYQSLVTLLPLIRKEKILKPEVIDNLEVKIYKALLPKKLEYGIEQVVRFWQSAPRSIQTDPELLFRYAEILIKQSADDEAENVLRTALKKGLNDPLMYLYGITNSSPKKQLAFAESFCRQASQNSSLLLTLGRLCSRNQLWGKARDYLERCLLLNPSPEGYQELGKVYDQLGKTTERDECYKKGLLCATE